MVTNFLHPIALTTPSRHSDIMGYALERYGPSASCFDMNLAAQGATQTIVVVEDDVLVRLAIADYLRGCGYQVIETDNADEALEVLRSNVAVDLVFSNIQLPGSMDGSGLARWVREHQPATTVVLTSGIVKSAEAVRELCEDGPVLQKPYHHEHVVQRIRALLASRSS